MTKNFLDIFIEKLSAGDTSYEDKLIGRAAERLMHVPMVETQGEGGATKIKIYCERLGNKKIVSVFTTEKGLQTWAKTQKEEIEPFSLLGGDLCDALGGDTWIHLYNVDGVMVELTPEFAARVSAWGSEEESIVAPPPRAPVQAQAQPIPAPRAAQPAASPVKRQAPVQVEVPEVQPQAVPEPEPMAQPMVVSNRTQEVSSINLNELINTGVIKVGEGMYEPSKAPPPAPKTNIVETKERMDPNSFLIGAPGSAKSKSQAPAPQAEPVVAQVKYSPKVSDWDDDGSQNVKPESHGKSSWSSQFSDAPPVAAKIGQNSESTLHDHDSLGARANFKTLLGIPAPKIFGKTDEELREEERRKNGGKGIITSILGK